MAVLKAFLHVKLIPRQRKTRYGNAHVDCIIIARQFTPIETVFGAAARRVAGGNGQ